MDARQETIKNELENIIGVYLKEQRLDLVELIYRQQGRDLVLRILVDRPEGGISLGECSLLNQEISRILDEAGIPEERYLLEVSSPGVDRSLKISSDFLRSMHKRIRFFLNEALNGKIEWVGKISKVEGESVSVEIEGGLLEIPLSKINKARQEI